MRRLLPALLVALSCHASQSLTRGTGESKGLPGSFQKLDDWRIEFRIHGFTFNDTYQTVFGTGSFVAQLASHDPGILIRSWKDGSQTCGVSFREPRTDVIVRLQRIGSSRQLTAEAWNTRDGGGYVASACPIQNPGSPDDAGSDAGLGGFQGALAYVRVYNTVVKPGTAPGNRFDGNLLDYELDGSGRDQAHGLNLTMNGAVFGPTPDYPPASMFGQYGQQRTFRAGGGYLTLDGSTSFSAADNVSMSYEWRQAGGPSQGSFSDPDKAVTKFSAPAAGTYTIELSVKDSAGLTGTHRVKIGGVKTDARGWVITGKPDMDAVLGPLTMWGTSPWPWYDLTEMATADALAPYQTKYPDPGTKLSGTVSVPQQNPDDHMKVVGSGTHFTTELKPNGYVGFAWKAPDGLDAMRRYGIESIIDDTHMQLWSSASNWPFPRSEVAVWKLDEAQYIFWGGSQNVSTNWNFYDNVLGLYRLYFRSGIDDYLNQARTLADGWYHYALDHGYSVIYPMYAGLDGLILRALDGKPAYWTGLTYYLRYPVGWTTQFKSKLAPGSEIEPRNSGYVLRAAAAAARLHPDPKVRSEFCGYIVNSVTNVWPNVQDDLGNFEEDVYGGNASYPYKAYNGHLGSSPWRATLALLGLEAAYDALSDPKACNNAAAAEITLRTSARFADFVHDYGTGSGRGQLYSVGFETIGQDPLGSENSNKNTPHTSGTLAVTQGSAIVKGNGTNFTTVFWGVKGATNGRQAQYDGHPMNEPTQYIGIPAESCHKVFRVAEVHSDTELVLEAPWPCRSATGITSGAGWVATWQGGKNCGPGRAAYCEGGPAGDRNLTHDIHAGYAWLAVRTKNRKYFDWALDSLGADYGGPAGGPGARGPGAGPKADGGHGNFSDALPVCGTLPCGGYGADNAKGKPFGMSAGAGNAPNAAPYLLQAAEMFRK